jgi:hypothetical protein
VADARADKVVVLDRARLRAKYGTAGTRRVVAAVDRLIDADDDRGIHTRRVDVSSTRSLRPYGVGRVTGLDAAAAVTAVDAICAQEQPDYLLLLGGPDVIPHVAVRNPLAGGVDPDPDVPSDLPYACTTGVTVDPARLVGPSRATGRLPDVPGASDPAALLALLRAARGWMPAAADRYRQHLTVSTATWRASTEETVDRLFGHVDVRLSPPDGPDWTNAQLSRPTHFFNLHGATADPRFFGESLGGTGARFPVAHEAADVDGRLATGALGTAECCYGAELFDPALAAGLLPMPVAYLAAGAYAYVGSTTVSYGPAVGNGGADLMCRYFIEEILGGASVGRAFLECRQRFVRDHAVLRPTDLKTLAQFVVYGDPSIHPVVRLGAERIPLGPTPDPGGDAAKTARVATRLLAAGRSERRRNLEAAAWALDHTTAVAAALPAGAADELPKGPAGVTPVDRITTVAATAGIGAPLDAAERKLFGIQAPDAAEGIAGPDDRLEVVLIPAGARRRRPPRRARSTLRRDPTAVDITVVTATVRDGEVVAWTTELTR